ncbi:hypothetical protein [Catellatospora chokoriensis]|uniref:Secreted protein n=1 Tax=Catellatospora chokoriensis TaxID=310353 RepID=A0A8J3K4M2_9ACTN|nr:hypothetical protein [Catellatospora chokoriensis]GIF90600.1 hypothetical protein Cch02nite_40440 [Catellatospora chokoriensis]
MRTLIRTAAMAAVAVVLATWSSPVATADDQPPKTRPSYYVWLRDCFTAAPSTGTIDTVRVLQSATGSEIELTGTITPCLRPEPTHAYGVATYSPTEAVGDASPYQLNTQAAQAYQKSVPVKPGVHAACLLTSETIRLACVSIGWDTVDGVTRPVAEGPLPVDSPLVTAPAVVDMFRSWVPIGPICPSCD